MPDEKSPHPRRGERSDPRSLPGGSAERDARLDEVERLKQMLRVEEQFPDADVCPACKDVRARSGDPTDLCPEHLKRVYGI